MGARDCCGKHFIEVWWKEGGRGARRMLWLFGLVTGLWAIGEVVD